MSYNWSEEAEKAFTPAEKVPAGRHWLRIEEIVNGGKNGFFQTADGTPKIMLVFRDNDRRECSSMYTLSPKAGMFLSCLLSRAKPSLDLNALTKAGITPAAMSEPEMSTQYIKGRYVLADVSWSEGKDGKQYADVSPVKTDESFKFDHPIPERKKREDAGAYRGSGRSTSPQGTHVPVDEDSCPF